MSEPRLGRGGRRHRSRELEAVLAVSSAVGAAAVSAVAGVAEGILQAAAAELLDAAVSETNVTLLLVLAISPADRGVIGAEDFDLGAISIDRRIGRFAHVMIAIQEHLRIGFLRVDTDKVADVRIAAERNLVSSVVGDDRSEGAGGITEGIHFSRAHKDLGGAQFVRHDRKDIPGGAVVGRAGRSVARGSSSAAQVVRSGNARTTLNVHGVLVAVIERPGTEGQANLLEVVDAVNTLRTRFGAGESRQQHGRQNGDDRDDD